MNYWPTQNQVEALLTQWKAEKAALQQKIDALELVLKIFDELTPAATAVSTLEIDIDVLKDCRTQREALREIAKHNGGIVRVREAAPLLLAAGLSQAKLSSITSTSYNQLNGDDEWEYVEPGTFKLTDTSVGRFTCEEHEFNGEITEDSELVEALYRGAQSQINAARNTTREVYSIKSA